MLAFLLCTFFGGTAAADTWLYRVTLDPAEPLVARVVVELPAARRAQDFSVQVRGLAAGLTPQVADLRCDGVPLAPDSASAWHVQGWSCVRLTWSVPIRAAEGGIDPGAHETAFDPQLRFWLFSEATSLLRPVGDTQHDGQVEFVGGGPVNGGALAGNPPRRVVPPTGRPAEYYVVGRLPGASLREGNIETLHLDALGVEWHELLADHGRALAYLIRAAGERQLAPLRSTVVWFAGHAEDGVSEGVAGYRTLLVAAAKRDGRLRHPEFALAWVVREQLLQSMPQRVPLWARESLAQYYAVKSLRRTELPAAALTAVEKRYLEPARGAPAQLLDAQRRVQAGDTSAMAELRGAGAVFWERLDRAIVRKSGFRTLDSVLPRLLAAEWPDGRLPPAVRDSLREYASEAAVKELLAQYLGY
jgi:hypothetical protein